MKLTTDEILHIQALIILCVNGTAVHGNLQAVHMHQAVWVHALKVSVNEAETEWEW